MTAIVVISLGGSVYLVADTLISREETNEHYTNDTLTLSTGIVIDQDTVPRTIFSENGLKIARMHENLAVGFSGDVISGFNALKLIARVKIERLDKLQSVVCDVLQNHVRPDLSISLIGFIILDGISHKFKAELTHQGELNYCESPAHEDTFCIGTGGERLKSIIQSTTSPSNDDDNDEVCEPKIAILAYLYKEYYASQAIRDLSAVKQYFGGALVCLFSTEQGVEWQKPMSIVIVQANGKGSTVKLSQMPHFQYSEIIDEKLLLLHTDPKNMELPQLKIATNSLSVDSNILLSDFERRATFNAEWIVYYVLFDMHGEDEAFAVFMQEGHTPFVEDRSSDGKLIGMQLNINWNFKETVYIGENNLYSGGEAVKRYLVDYLEDYESGEPDQKRHVFAEMVKFRTDGTAYDPHHFHRVIGWRMKYEVACSRKVTSSTELIYFIQSIDPHELTTFPNLKDSVERYFTCGSFRTVECLICEHCKNVTIDNYFQSEGVIKSNLPNGILIKALHKVVNGVRFFEVSCNKCGNLAIKEVPRTDLP